MNQGCSSYQANILYFTDFCLADLSITENILIIHYNGNFYQFLPVVLLFIYPETILLGTYNLELLHLPTEFHNESQQGCVHKSQGTRAKKLFLKGA